MSSLHHLGGWGWYRIDMKRAFRPLRIALGLLAMFALTYWFFGRNGWGPAASNESAIGEASRWCERVVSGYFREPSNALGNLGFAASGLAMLGILARDEIRATSKRNQFIGNTPLAILFASAAVFLGPGSMVMHGTHTLFGAWLDNVSMVAYILIPWLVNFSILGRWRSRRLFVVYGLLLAGYAAGYWLIGPDLGIGLDVFEVSIPLWVISEVLYRFWSQRARVWSGFVGFGVAWLFQISPLEIFSNLGEYWWIFLFWLPGLVGHSPPQGRRRFTPWYWIGFASFMTAYAIWLTGVAGHELCNPDALLQSHAIWHLLGAVSTFSFFMFFRTERPLAL